jgi:hypothetical protein
MGQRRYYSDFLSETSDSEDKAVKSGCCSHDSDTEWSVEVPQCWGDSQVRWTARGPLPMPTQRYSPTPPPAWGSYDKRGTAALVTTEYETDSSDDSETEVHSVTTEYSPTVPIAWGMHYRRGTTELGTRVYDSDETVSFESVSDD